MTEIVQMTTQQDEADKLPTHPVLGRWIACSCGHPVCKRVHPSRIGTFHEGTGFEPDEARELVINMLKPRGGKGVKR
jgi:hypothetical protein